MFKASKGNGRAVITITSIICIMLVAFAGIAAVIYINQQNLAQQKELKEKELQQEATRTKQETEQREADRREKEDARIQERADCRLNDDGGYMCYGL